MSIFLSTHINKIDVKKRVSIPVQFRLSLINESFQGIILFKSQFFNTVDGCGMSRMERLSKEIEGDRILDSFLKKQDDITADIFSNAIMLPFDQDGRVTLPEGVIKHANLSNQACFVGRGPMFQIWNPDNFEEYKQQKIQN
ncbi:division/cell wall cluster transcriptional repressor MraZ [Candidatus Gromoviella agglomerans]|uniref:division/cell wall cluster transcriptional repressor MraZ n=1 Tax=Candidatus Gromoviella agglomerans TaxID=2806609 RepID=UPI001E5A83AE|nr:division/cell wall cluster transcriptional repressor MraZ [Candidatus Gromoviella agglomerans]